MYLTTGHPTYLYVSESDQSRVVCPFSERSFEGHLDIYSPYGFGGFTGGGPWEELLAGWTAFSRDRGYVCGYIGMNPLLAEPGRFEPNEVHEYNDLYVLDLRLGEEALFKNLSKNRKRQVRALRRDDADYRVEPKPARRFFLERITQFYREKRAGPAYRFSRGTLEYLLEPTDSLIVGAGSGGKVQAACLFVMTEHIAEYFAGVSTPDGRPYSANLLWLGALELMRRGIPLLNLGGGVTRGDGIAGFKERFGARKVPLYAIKQVYRDDVYDQLCRHVGANPQDRAGFFPPYRKVAMNTQSS